MNHEEALWDAMHKFQELLEARRELEHDIQELERLLDWAAIKVKTIQLCADNATVFNPDDGNKVSVNFDAKQSRLAQLLELLQLAHDTFDINYDPNPKPARRRQSPKEANT